MNHNAHRKYILHPQYIILGLLIAGVSALFLGFIGSFLYSRVQGSLAPVVLPPLFYFNTVIILATSWTMHQAKCMYKDDETNRFKLFLALTLGLTVVFLGLQFAAWSQLLDMNIHLDTSVLASYMYMISGVHFLHLFAGIPFLIHYIYVAQKRMKDPVTVLVYFSDPDKYRGLNILNIYWHYLGALWIFIVGFFLVNYLI